MITINLNDIREVVEVTIGDHVYNVRRMGSGEELELSASNRRLVEASNVGFALQEKLQNLGEEPEEKSKQVAYQKELDKLIKQIDKVTAEITAEQKYQSESFIKLFDDGGDGSKSRELLNSFSYSERSKLIETIFAQKEVLDTQNSEEANTEALNG